MVKEKTFVFFCLCFFHLVGVFADELKSVSVMEGDSVTLQTNVTELQKGDRIKWKFGTNGSLIAKIFALTIDIPVNLTERFKDRLKLDIKTGSLTITNIRTEHAGEYEVEISRRSSSYKHRFNVTVYAATTTTPTPTTTTTTTKLSSTSQSSSGHTSSPHYSPSVPQTELILAASAGFLLIVAALVIFFIYRKHRKTDQQVKAREEEVTYADTTFVKRKAPSVKQEEDVVYAETVKAREEEVTYADTTFVKRKAPSVKQEEDVVYAGIVARR